MKETVKIAHIADVHWGAINPKKLYNDLKTEFVDYIKEIEDLDMIMILGDYFDKKIPLTDQSSILGIKFLNQLCSYTKKKNIEIRLIRGTKTHDFNQLDNFKSLESTFSNFRIINTVSEEIFNGLKFLYVPEEYMNDQEEYYREFKNNTWDCVYGHGTWDVFAFQNQISESERMIKGSPVFMYNEWDPIVKYDIIFGHIHVKNDHKKLHYPGSFERWCYGEEKEKGFLIQTIDLKNEVSLIQTIKNTKATEYTTVTLSNMVNENEDLKDTISKIEALKKDNSNFRVKVSKDMSLEDLNILKETFSNENSIRIELQSVKEQVQEKVLEEYDFLGNDVSENIQAFIKEKFGKDISLDEINEISKEDSDD